MLLHAVDDQNTLDGFPQDISLKSSFSSNG